MRKARQCTNKGERQGNIKRMTCLFVAQYKIYNGGWGFISNSARTEAHEMF